MSKEKIIHEIRVRVQESLYNQLVQKCDSEYKNLSELIRDIIVQYLKENK